MCYFQYTFNASGFLNVPMLNAIIPQFDDILIFLFFISTVIERIQSNNMNIIKNHFNLFVAAFLLLFFINGAINSVPVPIQLHSLKTYFIYILFFYCIIHLPYDEQKLNKLIRIIVICFCVQLPLLIMQYGLGLLDGTMNDDTGTGTFPGSNSLSYSVFFPLLFATYSYLVQGRKEYNYFFWLLLSVLILPMGEFAIASYFSFMAAFFVFNLFKSKKMLLRISIIIIPLIAGTFLFSFFKSSHSYSPNSIFKTINPVDLYVKIVQRQNDIHSGAQRNLYFPLTYVHLQKYSISPWIGFGPGMYASYTAFRFKPESNNLVEDAFHQTKYGMDAGVDSQIIPILGEFGFSGIILFLLFLIYNIFFFYKEYKKANGSLCKALAFVALCSALFLLIGFYVNHIWEGQPIFGTIMIFWGLFYLQKNHIKAISNFKQKKMHAL